MFLKYSPEIFEDFAWRYMSVNKPKDFHKKPIATPNHTPWLSPKIGKLPSNQLGLLIPGWIWSNLSKKSRKNLMLLPVFSASGVSLRFTVLLKRLGLRDVGRIKERSLDFRSLFLFGRESPHFGCWNRYVSCFVSFLFLLFHHTEVSVVFVTKITITEKLWPRLKHCLVSKRWYGMATQGLHVP